MSSLACLAARYCEEHELLDREGFELEGPDLYAAVVLAIAAARSEARSIVERLTSRGPCPNLYVGELRAAELRIRFCDVDMAALLPARVIDTTAEVVREAS